MTLPLLLPRVVVSRNKRVVSAAISMATVLRIIVVAVARVERSALLPHPFVGAPLGLASPVVIRRAVVMAGPIALGIVGLCVLRRTGLRLRFSLTWKSRPDAQDAEHERRFEQ